MEASLKGCRILWVDDQPFAVQVPRWHIEQAGAEVLMARSNDEALELVSTTVVDLVVADIARGDDEPGSELGIRLAASGVNVPLIHFTARVDPGPPPVGSIAVTNDDGELLRLIRQSLHR